MGNFKLGTILIKNLLKTFATAGSSEITFSETICSCPTPETTFFSISVILDFVCILSVNKGFTVFQNVLLSVMSRVPMLLKLCFIVYASGMCLLDCSKLAIKCKNDNDIIICWHDIIVIFFSFWLFLFLLSCLVTGPSFMVSCQYHHWFESYDNSLLQVIDQESRNRYYLCLSFSQYLEMESVRDTKFGKNVSSEMLLNAAKCLGYNFYRFWVIKRKPTWGGGN